MVLGFQGVIVSVWNIHFRCLLWKGQPWGRNSISSQWLYSNSHLILLKYLILAKKWFESMDNSYRNVDMMISFWFTFHTRPQFLDRFICKLACHCRCLTLSSLTVTKLSEHNLITLQPKQLEHFEYFEKSNFFGKSHFLWKIPLFFKITRPLCWYENSILTAGANIKDTGNERFSARRKRPENLSP